MERPLIGTHLAVLNLFREADGTVEITVAEARGAMSEPECREAGGAPIDYVEGLIVEAAARIEARRAAQRRRTPASCRDLTRADAWAARRRPS